MFLKRKQQSLLLMVKTLLGNGKTYVNIKSIFIGRTWLYPFIFLISINTSGPIEIVFKMLKSTFNTQKVRLKKKIFIW
jgi:hypothetical protein